MDSPQFRQEYPQAPLWVLSASLQGHSSPAYLSSGKPVEKTKHFLFVRDGLERIIYGLRGTAPLFSPHPEPESPPQAFRIIIISFFPHTAAPGVTPADPMEIDFVVELPASAN